MLRFSCVTLPPVSSVKMLTNHAHALLCVAEQPGMRLRDIAECVGVTERAAHRLVTELVDEGYLARHRVGRRNFYEVQSDAPLHHPLEHQHELGDVLRPLLRRHRSTSGQAA